MKTLPLHALALAFLISLLPAAHAETSHMTWRFINESGELINLQLYSQDRGRVWPSRQRVYSFNDGENGNTTIECERGEKICFGAWIKDRSAYYWGSGYDDQHGCKGCCRACNDGETDRLRLQ